MASAGGFVNNADLGVTALESPPLPTDTRLWRQSPDSQSASYSNRVPGSVLDSVKSTCGPKHASTARLHASQDLPTSVTRFLCLSSSSNSAAAKDLRRQLLVVRDCCVTLGNKVKGSELLLLGGSKISCKVEAMADFNSCLGVIFAASLTFTGETEGVAKDTLRGVVEMLKSAQESGDEKVFRAAVVTIVNRILLCTPLKPPARNAAMEAAQKSAGEQQHHAEQELKLKDECLDFLTVEDGVPVLLEAVWKRWLRYFEDGYVRYVKKLMAEERQALEAAAAAAAADDYNDEDAQYVDSVFVTATQTISTVPLFTTWQDYWKSPTSAYAQFCYLLLAIFFVRTKDFSLNYLARVTKLVQYFTYQLEFVDGEPIAVRTDTDAEEDSAQSEDKDDGRKPQQQERPRKEKPVHSLPMPEYDKAVTQRTFTMSRRSSSQWLAPTVMSFKKAEKPRRHCHKCFFTDALPGDLRPSVEAVRQEEAEAAARDSEEHSHLPVVRRSSNLDLSEHSISPQRQREQLDACDASMESVQCVWGSQP